MRKRNINYIIKYDMINMLRLKEIIKSVIIKISNIKKIFSKKGE